jgi:hypothetical protein
MIALSKIAQGIEYVKGRLYSESFGSKTPIDSLEKRQNNLPELTYQLTYG